MTRGRKFLLLASALFLLLFAIPTFIFVGSAATQPSPLYLIAGTFNPARGETLNLPADLILEEALIAKKGYGYYIVQFSGPVEQGWKDSLASRGVTLLEYIPDFAFKVRMNMGMVQTIRELPFVAYVGVFQPAFKISPSIKREGMGLYKVLLESGADSQQALLDISAAGGQVLGGDAAGLLVAADGSMLNALARVIDVAWIEPFRMIIKHNEYGGGLIIGANTANANGYDGSTQVVAVADTGLGGGTPATAHADIPSSRVTAIYNWRGVDDSCWTITDDGAVDVDSGHGTHTALSVLGDGGPSGQAKGSAPAANLVFQAVENWATMKGICALYYPNGYYLTGLPADLRTLFQQAYDAGARIHSNSWGSDAAGDYTADSAYVDDFIWFHRDILITFSAGNAGIDANSDGIVDNGSMGSPATAKNALTVGASENDRSGNWQCDTSLGYTNCASQGGQNSIFTYGAAWPADYPANPLNSDLSAGNAQQMAAFSSRGPADDSRIKPDIVAPGTWVLSGYSDLYQQGYDGSANPKNGAWQYDGWGYPLSALYKYMGGTSMSNPLTAGGAAVVRDFYQKFHGLAASAALVKATLINSAVDLLDENNDGANDNDYPIPNNHEGWGMVNLANATDGTAQFVDNTSGVGTGSSAIYYYGVLGSTFKVTLVWSDYPSTEAAAINLVNDLDLVVTSPGGTVYRGNVFIGGLSTTGGTADRRNNVENVYIASAQAGTWTVQVSGYNVPNGPQPFALVVDGSLGAPQPTNTPPPPTPTPTAAPVQSTGFLSPSANTLVISRAGDNNGFEVSAINAYLSDNLYAADNNSGTGTSTSCTNNKKDKHLYYNFNISLPGGAVVKGIQVQLEARADSTANSPSMCIELSWNGGGSWTASKRTTTLGVSDALFLLGGSTDTWGRSWTLADLGNTSFRLRITNVSSSTARDFFLDWLAVNIFYQP